MFIIGNLNLTTENTHLNDLLQIYDLTAFRKEPTCFKLHRPIKKKNKKKKNQKTLTFETGFPDHHKLVSTIMKSGIFKGPLKKKIYWSYKKIDIECFSNALREELEN